MEAPALSYLKTLKTSSTAHVLWDIMADFVKNEEEEEEEEYFIYPRLSHQAYL